MKHFDELIVGKIGGERMSLKLFFFCFVSVAMNINS